MKKSSCIFLSALLVLGATACTQENNLIKLSEVTHSVFYAPLYLADNLGYFKEEGIEIELTNGGGADNVMAAILSGSADVGFCGPEAALYVNLGGSKDTPVVFGQLTKRDGSFLISRTEEKNFTWENLRGKEILAGRKGGVPAMTFEYVLNSHGLENGKDVTLNFDVAFNMMTSAFESGVADYCTMFEPTASEYVAAGKGYLVASVGEESGEIPYTAFIAKSSYLNKNTTKIEKFLTAVMQGIRYVKQHSPEEVARALKASFPSTSEESLAASVRSYLSIDAWKDDMCLTKESFDRLQDVIENAGELQKRANYEDFIDNSYAEKIYKNMK